MFGFASKLRSFRRFQKRDISFADLKSKIEQTAFFQRIAKPFNNPIIRKGLRAVQVGGLTFLVFQTGYQRGIVSYSKDPEKFETEMMHWVLSGNGTMEYKLYEPRSELHTRVNRIVTRIITAAREFSQQKLNEAKAELKKIESQMKIETTPALRNELQIAQQNLQTWTIANGKMQVKWDIVVSDHQISNAFVTGFCPRKIFVYEGLIKAINPTDDELALILGHEISHVILGHTDEAIPTSAILMGMELIIMSLVDPVGIWTFFFDVYINKLREYIVASYSRSNEEDADELGMEVASKACFNVNHGAHVFKKLADLDKRTSTSWADTHPASIERYARLTELAKNYANSHSKGKCAEMQNEGVLSGLFQIFGH